MKTSNNKKKIFLFLGLILAVGIFVLAAPVQAGFEWAAQLLGGIIGWVISALGIILVLIIKALVLVAQYNNFIGSQAVENGWHIVRDVANMFFIVVLLIIAFATILNQEKYSYKTWLPKVILMAVLINFSKTICGLLIDVAQVVMLTFVNAFKGMAAGNMVNNLGIIDIVTIANNDGDLGFWVIIGSYFLGLLYMIVAIVTIVTMLAMLVMRMVMIWIYVVLSPLAYLFSAFPGGQKYSSMWWTEFSKNLIVGPVLAFFIWLSFVSMQSYNINEEFKNVPEVNVQSAAGELTMNPSANYGDRGGTKANELNVFLKFIISIGMLIGGLKIASEIGGAAGKIAGTGMAKLQKGAAWTGKMAKTGAKNLGMAAINQKGVRTALDVVGSQRGFIGGVLKATGVRKLAQQGSIALGQHKIAVEEKAKKRVDAIKKAGAARTMATIASEKAYTMSGKAARKEARKIFVVPEERFDKTSGNVGLDADGKEEAIKRLKDIDFKKDAPSLNQITQLGKSGIDLNLVPKFQAFLEKNSEARGAYNTGQIDGGLRSFVSGTDKNGNPLTGPGRWGVMTTDPDDIDKAIGRQGDNAYSFKTSESSENKVEKTIDVPVEEGFNLRVADSTNSEPMKAKKKKVVETPEILEQKQRIEQITGSKDKKLIESTRGRLHEWNTADSKDYFKDEGQIKEAFAQVKNEKSEARKQKSQEKKDQAAQVQKDELKQRKATEPGAGNLSINGFARGQRNNIGLDFAKLDSEIQQKMLASIGPGKTMADIKGVNFSNQDQIKQVSKGMVDVIDQEINALKNRNAGKEMPRSDTKRLANLERAKAKFKDPKKIKNLELINSSAKGYNSLDDVKDTVIHEGVHGRLRMKDEPITKFVSKRAVEEGKGAEVLKGGPAYRRYLEEYMDQVSGRRPLSKKSISKVIEDEDDDDDLNEYNMKTGESGGGGDNITNITNINNTIQEKDKIKNNFRSGGAINTQNSFLVYYFNNFIKSINKLSSSINKQSLKSSDKSGAASEPEEKASSENKNNLDI